MLQHFDNVCMRSSSPHPSTTRTLQRSIERPKDVWLMIRAIHSDYMQFSDVFSM